MNRHVLYALRESQLNEGAMDWLNDKARKIHAAVKDLKKSRTPVVPAAAASGKVSVMAPPAAHYRTPEQAKSDAGARAEKFSARIKVAVKRDQHHKRVRTPAAVGRRARVDQGVQAGKKLAREKFDQGVQAGKDYVLKPLAKVGKVAGALTIGGLALRHGVKYYRSAKKVSTLADKVAPSAAKAKSLWAGLKPAHQTAATMAGGAAAAGLSYYALKERKHRK